MGKIVGEEPATNIRARSYRAKPVRVLSNRTILAQHRQEEPGPAGPSRQIVILDSGPCAALTACTALDGCAPPSKKGLGCAVTVGVHSPS